MHKINASNAPVVLSSLQSAPSSNTHAVNSGTADFPSAPFVYGRKRRTVELLRRALCLADTSWLIEPDFQTWYADYRHALLQAGVRIIILQKVFHELGNFLYKGDAERSQRARAALSTILSPNAPFACVPSSTLTHADPTLLLAALNASHLHRLILLSQDKQLCADFHNILNGPKADAHHHLALSFDSNGVLTCRRVSEESIAPGCTIPACPELGHMQAIVGTQEAVEELYLSPREGTDEYLEQRLLPFSRLYMSAAALAEALDAESETSALLRRLDSLTLRPRIHVAEVGLAAYPGLREKLLSSRYYRLFRILPEQPRHAGDEELALLDDMSFNFPIRCDVRVKKLVLMTTEHEMALYRSINARLPKCYRRRDEQTETPDKGRNNDLPLWGCALSATDGCLLRACTVCHEQPATPMTTEATEAAAA